MSAMLVYICSFFNFMGHKVFLFEFTSYQLRIRFFLQYIYPVFLVNQLDKLNIDWLIFYTSNIKINLFRMGKKCSLPWTL